MLIERINTGQWWRGSGRNWEEKEKKIGRRKRLEAIGREVRRTKERKGRLVREQGKRERVGRLFRHSCNRLPAGFHCNSVLTDACYKRNDVVSLVNSNCWPERRALFLALSFYLL